MPSAEMVAVNTSTAQSSVLVPVQYRTNNAIKVIDRDDDKVKIRLDIS